MSSTESDLRSVAANVTPVVQSSPIGTEFAQVNWSIQPLKSKIINSENAF